MNPNPNLNPNPIPIPNQVGLYLPAGEVASLGPNATVPRALTLALTLALPLTPTPTLTSVADVNYVVDCKLHPAHCAV